MHWATQYIGTPWKLGGNNIDGFDCFGLVRFISEKHFNISISPVELSVNQKEINKKILQCCQNTNMWQEVDKEDHGCVVLLSKGFFPCHTGIWLKDSKISGLLHSICGIGVMFSNQNNLRNAGWTIKGYFKNVEHGKNNLQSIHGK